MLYNQLGIGNALARGGAACMNDDGGGAEAAQEEDKRGEERNVLESVVDFLKWLTSSIPIVGKLWLCRKSHLREAFYEVASVLLFSALPIWFFPLISYLMFNAGFPIDEVVRNGELYIYAASLSGTMVYFISKRYGSLQGKQDGAATIPFALGISFPYGGLFVMISALICMISSASFFVLKSFEKLPAQKVLTISSAGSASLSWWLFLVSTVLFYCAVAYRNLLEDHKSFQTKTERDLLEDWERHK